MFFDHWANIYAIALLTPALFLVLIFINKSKFATKCILVASFIKWILMIMNCYGQQFYFFDPDFDVLHPMARQWASMPISEMFSDISNATGRYFFAFLLGLLYRGVGEALSIVFLVNILLTAVVASSTYDALKLVINDRYIARIGFLVVLFFPAYYAYSIEPSREPLVQAGFIIGIKYFLHWMRDFKASRIPVVIVSLSFAASIHSAMAVVLLFTCGAMLFESFRRGRTSSKSRRVLSSIVLVAVSSLILPAVIFSGWALKKVGGSLTGVADIEVLSGYETRQDAGNRTGYIKAGDQAQFSSAGEALLQVPIRLVYFTTKPWPWNVSAPLDLIAFSLNILILVSLYWIVFRRSQIRRYGGVSHIGLCVVGLCLMFAFGTVNWGTATRHKMKFFPAVVLVLAVRSAERRMIRAPFPHETHRRVGI